MTENLHNWAGNYQFTAARIHRPTTVGEVQDLVKKSNKVKAIGTRHSFNNLADTDQDLISTENLNRVLSIDHDRQTVSIQGGISYGQLAKHLFVEGFGLHNLASLPHISVAGACATGTHGSGDKNGNLSTAVSELEIVKADGSLMTLSRANDGDKFLGAVVNIGALGIVTGMTLNVQPAYEVRQDIYENLPFSEIDTHFDTITSSGYSVSLFTAWKGDSVNQVWLKRIGVQGPADPEFFGARLASAKRHPIGEIDPINCTDQMGAYGPWYDRLPHFRLDFTPSSGEELQSEYLVPRQHAVAALHAIKALQEQIAPLLLISEIRMIAADNFWMSPCYQQDCIGIHFTWKPEWESVRALLPTIEAALAPFYARPHWGKLFTMSGDKIRTLYSRFADFKALTEELDPTGKFRNEYLDSVLG